MRRSFHAVICNHAGWNRAACRNVRAVKSSFTIRVDRLFTASDEALFTNAHHRPVKTPAIA